MATYADSGVDVEIEEQAAKILYNAAKKSWNNRSGQLGEIIFPFDDFSGIRVINVGNLPKGTVMNVGFDGVGTKARFAEIAQRYDTLAYDLIAMVCDDAVIRGGEPVLVGSILDVNSLGKDSTRLAYVRQLARGYIKAASKANVAIINGEIAQLGTSVGDNQNFSLNWGAAVVWFAHKDRLITGHKVAVGDFIVGLEEKSLRSNGISLVRSVLTKNLGSDWPTVKLGSSRLIDLVLKPSAIYSPAIVEMFGGWEKQTPKAVIHAAANITGSGLPGKLGRALKLSGLGAHINTPRTPPKLMLYCQETGKVNDKEAYRTWHMGQGMVVVTPDPDTVMAITHRHGIQSSVIGRVVPQKGISIVSQGYFSRNQLLRF